MAVNLEGLTAYVEEKNLPLIRKASLGAPTAKYFALQTGVKGKMALNLLETTIAFGDGGSCGWEEAGTSKLSQRTINGAPLKINMSFCDKKMLKYWMNYEVRVAAGQKNLPFAEDFINGVIDGVNESLDKFIWQGDTIGGTKYKGILELMTDASVSDLGKGATIYDSTLKVYNALPAASLKDSSIYMGVDTFRSLVMELTAKNLYHYAPEVDETFEIVLPGTIMKVRGVPGLNGTNKIVGLNNKHTVYGTDLENDEEKFELWYSQDNREYRLAIEFVAGTQFAYPDECKFVNLGD